MRPANIDTNPERLLEKFFNTPDLKELHGYLAPILIKSHNALQNADAFSDHDDVRKVENILAKDLPGAIENYLAMPMDYRNSKKINESATPRELLIKSIDVLVQALRDIEERNLAGFEKKTLIDHKIFKEKYAVEVEPENAFQSQFDWKSYQKNNPQTLDSILVKDTQTESETKEKKDSHFMAFLKLFSHLSFSFYRSKSFAQGWPEIDYFRMSHRMRNSNAQKDLDNNHNGTISTPKETLELRLRNVYSNEEVLYYMLTLIREVNRQSRDMEVMMPMRKSLAENPDTPEKLKNVCLELQNTIHIMNRYAPLYFKANAIWDFPRRPDVGTEEAVMALGNSCYMEELRQKIAHDKWETNRVVIKDMVMKSKPDLIQYYFDALVERFAISNEHWERAIKNTTYYVVQRAKKDPKFKEAIKLESYTNENMGVIDNRFYKYRYMKNLLDQINNGEIIDPAIQAKKDKGLYIEDAESKESSEKINPSRKHRRLKI
jgi:hypothetical protein